MRTVDGRDIDYQEAGSGPAVLFVPGSFSTPAVWRGLQQRLAPGYRIIATSLCGYGGTDETRTLDDLGMAHQARIIDFWGGAGSFAAMPALVQDYCRATAYANAQRRSRAATSPRANRTKKTAPGKSRRRCWL